MSPTSFQWNAQTLKERAPEWILNLQDFPKPLQLTRQTGDTEDTWLNYRKLLAPWAAVAASLLTQIRSLLFEDTGVVILRCGAQTTDNQARLVELLVGCSLGENMTITPGTTERPLFQVTASEDNTAGGQYLGNGLKRNAIGLHTDGSGTLDRRVQILAMLYLRPARFGGQSRIANSQLVFAELTPNAAAVLCRSFPRQSPYKDQEVPTKLVCMPIFSEENDRSVREFSYHPTRVRNGIKLTRATSDELEKSAYDPNLISDKLTAAEDIAFLQLDRTLDRTACEVSLERNELLILNNQIVTHDRRAFSDDPRSPRLMERFWAGQYRPDNAVCHLVGQLSCAACRPTQ